MCSLVILIVGVYTAVAVAVTVFIVNGTIVPDGVLFYDSPAPTLAHTLLFIGAGSLVVAAFAVARHKLTEKPPQ